MDAQIVFKGISIKGIRRWQISNLPPGLRSLGLNIRRLGKPYSLSATIKLLRLENSPRSLCSQGSIIRGYLFACFSIRLIIISSDHRECSILDILHTRKFYMSFVV